MGLDINILENRKIKTPHDKKEAINSILDREITFSFLRSEFGDKRKEAFFSELSILLSSGLDISSAFQVIVEQEKKATSRQIIEQIFERIMKGMSIFESIAQSGKFSEYDYFCIKIGEESGQLTEVLNELSSFYTRKIKYKRKFVNALTYPLLVLFTAVLSVIFMLNFLVPMFVDVFSRTNSELPDITRFIISLSHLTSEKLPLVIFFIILLVIILFLNKRKETFRRASSTFLLGLPIFGGIVRLVYIERLIISMTLLMKSKVTIVKAIGLIKNMIGFYPIEQALISIEANIIRGKPLYESMSQFGIFDKKLITMVKVGEEVNQLELIFEKLGKQYSEELEYKINNVSNLLEPILIVFVGLIVGVILIAMYLPIFQIGNSIS